MLLPLQITAENFQTIFKFSFFPMGLIKLRFFFLTFRIEILTIDFFERFH